MNRGNIQLVALRFVQVTSLLAYSVLVIAAEPFFSSRSQYCPMISGMPWRDYLSGNFDAGSPLYVHMVGIKFIFANQVRDPVAMYNVDPGICYGVRYIKEATPGFPKGYFTYRLYGYERKESNKQQAILSMGKSGLEGNPNRWEVNIDQHIFIYNSLGEIFDTKGRRVGQMFCYTGNDCGQYKY